MKGDRSVNLPAKFNHPMKMNRVTTLVAVALGSAAFFATGHAQNENLAEASSPPAKDVAASTTTAAVPGPTGTVQIAATANSNVTEWADIQDYTYDMRAQFFVGLNQLEARVDRQVSRLMAKRAMIKNITPEIKDWDFAMKEMEDAQSYLRSMGEELSKAPRETWDQEKDKVHQAWVRTQNDYEKVKVSTTD